MGMPQWTLCVRCWDAERPRLHSQAERGNDQAGLVYDTNPVGASLLANGRDAVSSHQRCVAIQINSPA
ncbi:hypothetical protein CCX46_09100 [Pseudomonas sp. RU47]|nr:hypothetical protein CCX46_09100 [Pseudomonas sp. RU47]